MTTHDIKLQAGCLPLVLSCDIVKDGSFRMATPFKYPEGGNIDIFLRREENLFDKWVVSDYGMTQAHLLDLHIKPWATAVRREIFKKVCRDYGVDGHDGELKIQFGDIEKSLQDAVTRLGMACLRISDICFTHRFRLSGVFRDDIEEFIDLLDSQYEANPSLIGRFGEEVKLDFLFYGTSSLSLIDSISSMSSTTLHGALETSFCKWSDLSNHKERYSFITLIDSSSIVSRQADVKRLQEVSTVMYFPADSKSVQEMLIA